MSRKQRRRQEKLARTEAAKQSGNNPEDALRIAGHFFQSGKLDQAIKILEGARHHNPEHFEVAHGLAIIHATQGDLDGALALFEKAVAIRPGDAEAQFNLGLALTEKGRPDEAIAAYRRSLENNPHEEAALINLGNVFNDVKDFTGAADCFRRALEIKPDNAMAHTNLGNVLVELERFDAAFASYRKAIHINPSLAEAHVCLGNAFKECDKLEEAIASQQQALALEPDHAGAHYNLGVALQALGRLDEADARYRKAIAIDPDDADAHHNLGMVLLSLGNFEEGWREFSWRWKTSQFSSESREFNNPPWEGEALAGKQILVWEEQGVGESLLFAGLISELVQLGAEVSVACEPRLAPLFARSFPETACIPVTDPIQAATGKQDFDCHAPMADLGRWLRPDAASFHSPPGAYLAADPDHSAALRGRYLEKGGDLLVGLAWFSKSPHYAKRKSMTLDDLGPVLGIPGITFVDLQYGDTEAARAAFTARTGIGIIHDDGVDQMADLDAFAAQVAALDAVVTISNTTAHMAGGLGVATLLMLDTSPIWYWRTEGEDSPWYPLVKLFRQRQAGDWGEVVGRVEDAVKGILADRR